MDRMLLLQNILEALVFVVSTILFAVLYGLIDKKIRLTDKIFGAFKIEPKLDYPHSYSFNFNCVSSLFWSLYI